MLRLRITRKKRGDALPYDLVDVFLEDRDKINVEFEYLEEKKPTEART